jgi:crossover junction endodeoxyribonuclease RuvC
MRAGRRNMVIIGIDPGLAHTGYGILRCGSGQPEILDTGVVSTRADLPLEERLLKLHAALDDVFQKFLPDIAVVEGLYSKSRNPQASILMGHARGVILMLSAARGIPVKTYSPAKIKRSLTGNGNCSKKQVQRMVKMTLNLERDPSPDHIADALAAGLCHISCGRIEKLFTH